MKHLLALLVVLTLMAGVVSVYADDAATVPAQGTAVTQTKDVKKDVKKAKKHHKHGKKKAKDTAAENAEPAAK